MHKKSQLIMVWLLPIIVIGGLFVPILGYLVIAMMAFLLTISAFKGRHWCWNLCPRGAFLDITMSKASRNKQLPRDFTRQWVRWLIVIAFMSFFVFRIKNAGGSFIAIGSVAVGMCMLTTAISIVLAILAKHRAWCMICPMGTLQESIHKIFRKKEVK